MTIFSETRSPGKTRIFSFSCIGKPNNPALLKKNATGKNWDVSQDHLVLFRSTRPNNIDSPQVAYEYTALPFLAITGEGWD